MRSAWVLTVVLLAPGCGRLGFEQAQPCSADLDCASNHCAGVCCDTACDGTCNSCETGTCLPLASACSGDCATCEASGAGFSCVAVPAACAAMCSSATCDGAATSFSCNTSSCCATAGAPNAGGSCATAPSVLLGDGCHFTYDYASWNMSSNFVELQWDEEVCQGGTWVPFDVGTDAVPCAGCAHETRNTWTDSCGSAAGLVQVCP